MAAALAIAVALLPPLLASGTAPPPPKVEHFVVLFMENRPFDHIFGCATAELKGIDGLTGREFNWRDPNDHSKGRVYATCGDAPYVCEHDNDHSFPGTTVDIFGPNRTDGAHAPYPPPTMGGFANRSGEQTMRAFKPEQLPIKLALAREFAVFDRFHAAVPGPSQPNHMFAQSATACGVTETGTVFTECGGLLPLFPQRTIYDALLEAGHEFNVFINGSLDEGVPGDVFLWGLLRHLPPRLHTFSSPRHGLFARAAAGTLPALSWVLPRGGGDAPNDDHPCHDVALGEALLKAVYEALRAGPKWESTALLVVYDDAGGFFDHAPTPMRAPPPRSPCDIGPGCPDAFSFDRLGLRLAALLISPFVPRGHVIHDPPGPPGTPFRPAADSKYELSSIPATLKHLFGLPRFLTERDAWAGAFHGELALERPRRDTPARLPEPPQPAAPHGRRRHGCSPTGELTRRQRRQMQLYARLLGEQAPGWLAGAGSDESRADAVLDRHEAADRWLGYAARRLLTRVRDGVLPRLADEL